MTPTSEDEIVSILKALEKKSAAREVNKYLILQVIAYEIAKPFTHILNEMSSGSFPDRLKIACVTLLHKGEKCSGLKN